MAELFASGVSTSRSYSLYGEHREPTPEMLRDLDAIVVDLQDIGARYYTFIWTLYLTMRASSAPDSVVVLDRPNPLNGLTTKGRCSIQTTNRLSGCIRSRSGTGKRLANWRSNSARNVFRKQNCMFCRCAAGSARCGLTRPACLGDALAQHADARYRDGLSGNVSARGDKYFRGPRNDATIRDFRRAVHRCGSVLSRDERRETSGRAFSRNVFPTDVPQVCGRSFVRQAVARD